MRDTIMDWINKFGGAVLLACIGATLQCVRGEWHGWKNFVVSNAMAAFGAVIVMSILPNYVPTDVSAGVAGIVGYSGGSLIDAVLVRARKEIEETGKGGE